MKFTLRKKDYKSEIYESDIGDSVKAVVKMKYHTTRRYWDVIYVIEYGNHFQTEHLISIPYIENRREARKIAKEIMSKASPKDISKLSNFYKNKLREFLDISELLKI